MCWQIRYFPEQIRKDCFSFASIEARARKHSDSAAEHDPDVIIVQIVPRIGVSGS